MACEVRQNGVRETPFSLCFGVPIVEALDIFAVCRVLASALETPQKPEKTLILETNRKIGRSTHLYATICRFFGNCVFPAFCVVFCAFVDAQHSSDVGHLGP